jgi:ketosteroid isomerase-like protein
MKLTNTELVRNFINAYNSFDIDTMLKCLHPDVIFKNISGGEVNAKTSGINEFENLARQSAAFFKEREQEIKYLTESEGTVKVELEYYAVLNSDEVINLKGRSEYKFRDGLIYSIIDES